MLLGRTLRTRLTANTVVHTRPSLHINPHHLAKSRLPTTHHHNNLFCFTTTSLSNSSRHRRTMATAVTDTNTPANSFLPPVNPDLRKTLEQITAPSLTTADPNLPRPNYSHLDPSQLPPGYEWENDHRFATYKHPLEMSSLDKRSYRLMRLPNGLEALVINDPEADKASAALSVRVGSLSDPEDLPGLAHFCEHLLFMGSEKYPAEDKYEQFLNNNNGTCNAYTALDTTNYFFDVSPNALGDALDIFAQFFICPIFDPSCTEREIRAVDSENQKNLTSDAWRKNQLEKSLTSPNHVYWRFGTGNLDTLWNNPRKLGVDVRDELIKFHSKHYSANLMKLVILGKESLNELSELVLKSFSNVPNKSIPPSNFTGNPLTSKELETQIMYKSIKDTHTLELVFPLEDQSLLYASKPGSFIAHFIGHEGKGSLLSYLKQKEWAITLAAGPDPGAGFSFFKIQVYLSKAGYENYQEVTKAVFSYLNLLRSAPPLEWAYQEIEAIKDIDFKFRESIQPDEYTASLADDMQEPYPRNWLLSAPSVLKGFDPNAIAKTLETLTIQNCRIMLASQNEIPSDMVKQTEKWYGTEYATAPLSNELIKECANPSSYPELSLPTPNAFIPKDLEIHGKQDGIVPVRKPNIVKQNDEIRVWHKKDDRWWVPRVTLNLRFINPEMSSNPRNKTLTSLYTVILSDVLTELSYDATIAGFDYSVTARLYGLLLHIAGYNDKLPVLLNVILEKMKNFDIDNTRFDTLKTEYKRSLENQKYITPVYIARDKAEYLLTQSKHDYADMLEVIDDISLEEIKEFMVKSLNRMFMDMLVHGNMYDKDVLSMSNTITNMFKYEPLPASEKLPSRALYPPPGKNTILRLDATDPNNVNSAVEYFCYTGDGKDTHNRLCLQMFDQLTRQHTFHVLRTTEQLGYITASMPHVGTGVTGYAVLVQGERDAAYIESRIYEYIKSLGEWIEKMSDEEFEENRASIIDRKLEEPKNLGEEAKGYWISIVNGHYEFERRFKDIEPLKKLTKQDVLEFYKTFIDPNSSQRSKFSVHHQSARLSPNAASSFLEFISSNDIQVPDTLNSFIENRPKFSEFYEQLESEFLPSMGVSEDLKPQILAKAKDLSDFKYADGNQIFTSRQEMKATHLVADPVEPSPDSGFDLNATI